MARFDASAADLAGMVSAQGSGEVFYELGLMYASGRSVPVDLVTAHKWLNVAALKSCAPAAALRAELALDMTRDEIAAAQRAAREFLARR